MASDRGRPPRFDFSSILPMVGAARDTNTQVIWDIMHYGWPDYLDIWKPAFIDRFAAFARAFAQLIKDETDTVPFYVPINEISFFAWAGGDVEYLNPFARGRGGELKRILVRAAIAATEAIKDVEPRARFVTAEPLIHVIAKSEASSDIEAAQRYNDAQFETMDMLSGSLEPALGGRAELLDIVGLNYYFDNQWIDRGQKIFLGDRRYKPLSELIAVASRRYSRPLFISETGTEGSGRAPWLFYICDEIAEARAAGVFVEGVCLYPILNHPGWDDDRHCHNGLFCGVAANGARTPYTPMVKELLRQRDFLSV